MSVILYSTAATLSTMLQTWQDLGVFEFLLPFMLVFAIVFGILTQAKILGENKAVNATIALAIGLFAILFPQARLFFAHISSNMAIGVVVLLAAIIMVGLFANLSDKKSGWSVGMAVFGGLIALVVILVSLSSNNFIGGFWWWSVYWPHIVVGLVVIGAIVAIVATSKKAGP